MTIQEIKELLEAHRDALRDELGVEGLYVFGSVARGASSSSSDVDVIVDLDGDADFDRFMELRERLESLLGAPVDLVTRKAIRPALRSSIEQESIRVA